MSQASHEGEHFDSQSTRALMKADRGYDEDRMAFGRELVARGGWKDLRPADRSGYPRYGLPGDGVITRIAHGRRRNLPPLIRAQPDSWSMNHPEALVQLEEWTSRLAKGGFLDVLSIPSPQLDHGSFGRIREGARPILIQGPLRDEGAVGIARMMEEGADIAWAALSFWWFSRLDGRGALGLQQNLERQFEALDLVVASGKPMEPDVPRHFASHGADDTSYVVSGWLVACAAKERGLRDLVLQVTLNTPNRSWGVNDLAKARALLQLVRELEDGDFSVHLLASDGSDSPSGDEAAAKARLAALTALMDDIEPWDAHSPEIIDITNCSEETRLVDPDVLEDSIRLRLHALSEWRRLRAEGLFDDSSWSGTVLRRTSELLAEARSVIAAICATVPAPFGPAGFFKILSDGFLPLSGLPALEAEFPEALRWKTALVDGAIKVVDDEGIVVPAGLRMPILVERMRGASPSNAVSRG